MGDDSGLIPDWCEWGRGDGPIFLIAPHGGRRPPIDAAAPPPRLRVNDLYTPELTRLLAARLDATFIINRGQDRNRLDLNRLSQVRRHAPWFLELLAQEMGRILERHACVELIFVHGWNTGQTKCDIGIGATETEAGLPLPDGARLTVSETYLRARIATLRAACAAAGIQAPLGERYPASHPNNVLQLFAARDHGDDATVRRIADWVAQNRVQALQLELAIPLRWPGMWRERFIEAAVAAFASPMVNVHVPSLPLASGHSALSTQHSLQFYDPVAGVGLSAGVGRVGHITGGRLLLFLGGQRVALFTGEEAHPHASAVAPLTCTSSALEFAGPMLVLDDAATYLDLEAALAASRLVEGAVSVRFEPLLPLHGEEDSSESPVNATPRLGRFRGRMSVGDREITIDTTGFANAGGFRAVGSRPQTMLAATFDDEALLSREVHGDGGSTALHFTPTTTRALNGAAIAVSNDGDANVPEAFALTCDDYPPLHATPLSRMAILRPAGHGRYLRVTFGVAGFRWGEREGYGLYEHATPVNSDK
jgi:hypothetical protein